MSAKPPEDITLALGGHQRETEWRHRDLALELQKWVGLFEEEYSLQIPDVALAVGLLRGDILGHYHIGRNEFGIRGEVAINERYVTRERFWRVLVTLLHELVHAWQYVHGFPGKSHNREFRDKAASLGVIHDVKGRFVAIPAPSRFRDLLTRHGVTVPPPDGYFSLPGGRMEKAAGPLWKCACTTVRVKPAYGDLNALCHTCGQPFALVKINPTPAEIRECARVSPRSVKF